MTAAPAPTPMAAATPAPEPTPAPMAAAPMDGKCGCCCQSGIMSAWDFLGGGVTEDANLFALSFEMNGGVGNTQSNLVPSLTYQRGLGKRLGVGVRAAYQSTNPFRSADTQETGNNIGFWLNLVLRLSIINDGMNSLGIEVDPGYGISAATRVQTSGSTAQTAHILTFPVWVTFGHWMKPKVFEGGVKAGLPMYASFFQVGGSAFSWDFMIGPWGEYHVSDCVALGGQILWGYANGSKFGTPALPIQHLAVSGTLYAAFAFN